MTNEDIEIELSLRGINWQSEGENRTLIYNLTLPLVRSNVDLCLFNLPPTELVVNKSSKIQPDETAPSIIALGELKGGIDPVGADEHWKTEPCCLPVKIASIARWLCRYDALGAKHNKYLIS